MAINLLDFAAQFQNPMMTGIVRKWMQESVFMRILNFIPVDGFAYQYGEEAAGPGISYRSLNQAYGAQAASVINPKIETMPIFGGEVKTDAQIYNKQGNAARANEIARKQRAAALFFDHEVIHGDGAVDPKAITGLYARLAGDQLLVNADNGAKVKYEKVLDLLDAVYGKNSEKVLIMNKVCKRQLLADMAANAGGLKLNDLTGQLETFDGARVEIIDEDEQETPTFQFNETCGASEVTTSILCVHPGSTTDKEGMQGLTGSGGIQVIQQGWNGPFWVDLVEGHCGIALFHGRAAARLKGITAS